MHYINDTGSLVAGRTVSLLALVACGQLVYMHGGDPFFSKSKPATSAKLGYLPSSCSGSACCPPLIYSLILLAFDSMLMCLPPTLEMAYTNFSPMVLQVNEFEGGGVAFGLSCTHMNADPTSITILFKSWIESHRQEPIEHPPLFKSTTLHHQQVPNTSTKPDNYYATKGNAETPSVKMVTATFKFSDSAIKKWLDEVRDQCAKATPFDLLAALFWTRVAHLKAPKNDNKHSLSICLDFRRLVQPPIPLGYFGNALHFSLLTLDEEEMDYGKLGHVVELVHRHVSDVGEEEVWSVVDWFESQKEEGGKYAQPFTMYGPELTCVSMEHMILGHKSLMFSASFKSDEKPVHVACHVGNVRGEGLIVVLPSVEEGLARTVMVTLPEEEMPKLCEDQAIQCLQPTLLIGGR